MEVKNLVNLRQNTLQESFIDIHSSQSAETKDNGKINHAKGLRQELHAGNRGKVAVLKMEGRDMAVCLDSVFC